MNTTETPRIEAALNGQVEIAKIVNNLERELIEARAEVERQSQAITQANWLLSGLVDAGGGTKALLEWASAREEDRKGIQPILKELAQLCDHDQQPILERRSVMESATKAILALRSQLAAALAKGAEMRAALRDYADRCPNCAGRGFYVFGGSMTDAPEQVQCEWCDRALQALSDAPSPYKSPEEVKGLEREVERLRIGILNMGSDHAKVVNGIAEQRDTARVRALEGALEVCQSCLQSFVDLHPGQSAPEDHRALNMAEEALAGSGAKGDGYEKWARERVAHAAGRLIQCRTRWSVDHDFTSWTDCDPKWEDDPRFEFRVHPDDDEPAPQPTNAVERA
jgi:hypothetical protein